MLSDDHIAAHGYTPEVALWRCVLRQAQHDLKSKATLHKTEAVRRGVMAWIGTTDFFTCCALAQVSPVAALAVFDALAHAHG